MHARTLITLFAAGVIGSTITPTVDHVVPWRASAQEVTALVQAQRIELVDTNGTARGVFGMADSGRSLTLNDASGQVRLTLEQTIEGTYQIQLRDADGTPRFGVGTTSREGGFVGLNVRDKSGAIGSRLFASYDGKQTGFQVQDPGPKLRAEMALKDWEAHVGFLVRDSGVAPPCGKRPEATRRPSGSATLKLVAYLDEGETVQTFNDWAGLGPSPARSGVLRGVLRRRRRAADPAAGA